MRPKVVMVVDDDASMLKSITRLLTAYGFVTQTFTSAEALLAGGGTCAATCLLLDIHLGGISGIELNRRLSAAGSTCPIIFMTAIDDEATRQEAIDAGCIAYLRKPFGANLLLDAIGKVAA
jgi:FixJ family two-component response regulator